FKKAGCKRIFVDTVSGIAAARPGIDETLSHLRRGDTLVVWRLDRLGRSLKHLIDLISKLEDMDIGFHSIQESIDTTTRRIPSSGSFTHRCAGLSVKAM
ncbi:MAG: recombinase family protein, partial [Desulfobacteraceae bacterium]